MPAGFTSESALQSWIRDCRHDGIDDSEICVLARTNELVRAMADALKPHDVKTCLLARKQADDRRRPGIRLGTMHRAKGLEFAAIAMVDVNADVVPPRWLIDGAPDAVIRNSIVDADKALLHVSATRAKKRLLVATSGPASELIAVLNGTHSKAA